MSGRPAGNGKEPSHRLRFGAGLLLATLLAVGIGHDLLKDSLAGLSRYGEDTGLETDYIVVELAEKILGAGWQKQFLDRTRHGGIERVLL